MLKQRLRKSAAPAEIEISSAPCTADWDWREAFYLDAKVNNVSQKVVMVPFAEAGQKTDGISVWLTHSK